ncbi:MAG: hypothetical protein PHQ75_11260 [Thermoguttaceae bacterium]|nr:hypothetical protein [Thermoguttaceae bacterium]
MKSVLPGIKRLKSFLLSGYGQSVTGQQESLVSGNSFIERFIQGNQQAGTPVLHGCG